MSQFPSNVNMATYKGGKGKYFLHFFSFSFIYFFKSERILVFLKRSEKWGVEKTRLFVWTKVKRWFGSFGFPRSRLWPDLFVKLWTCLFECIQLQKARSFRNMK